MPTDKPKPLQQTPLEALLEPYRIYTVRRFAEVTGLSIQRAGQLWHGKSGMSIKMLLHIAKTTGVSAAALLALYDPDASQERAPERVVAADA